MKKKYQNGTVFAVPLSGGGYAAGVVTHLDGSGAIVAYFLADKFSQLPSLKAVNAFRVGSALTVRRLADVGIVAGKWSILGQYAGWCQADWPLPSFGRPDALDDELRWIVEYVENDLITPRCEVHTSSADARALPQQGYLNAAATERLLSHLLSGIPSIPMTSRSSVGKEQK